MTMKKILYIAILFCALYPSLQAQVYIGGSLNAWTETINKVDHTSVNFYPEIGYGFKNHWHIGVVMGFGQTMVDNDVKSSNLKFNPYVGYTFYENQIAALFVEGGFSYLYTKPAYGDEYYGLEVGFNPGIKVKLSNRLSMRAHYAFIGFRDNGNDISEFGIKMNLEALKFGFHYSF